MKELYNITFIDNYLKKENISKTEFCKRCEISMNILNKIYKHKPVGYLKVLKIVKLLEIDFYMFIGC